MAAGKQTVNHASAVADYDFGVDDDTPFDMNIELVSHTCAKAVEDARMNANMTQAQLATACNEKPAAIVAVENGTAKYDASLINRIEQALKV